MFAIALQGFIKLTKSSAGRRLPIYGLRLSRHPGTCECLRCYRPRSGPNSTEVVGMSKSKFTEADVRRAVKGVLDGGGRVSSVEIWPDGRISVTVKEDKKRSMDPEDDPEVSRRLL